MQAVTHLALGAALGGLLPKRTAPVAVAAALTHPLLDDLALSTYHPPDPLLDDPFWVVFHACVGVGTLVVAWRFRRRGWVMFGAMIPDLDWVLRPLGLWTPGALHDLFRSIPGLAAASGALRETVPDLRLVPAAAAIEGLFVVAFLWLALRRAPDRGER